MGVLYLLMGLALGCLVGGLFIRNKFSGSHSEVQNRINALETERLLAVQRLESANRELERVITDYNQRITKLDAELKQANADNLTLNNRIAASIEKFSAQEQRLADQKVTLEEAYKKMVMEFQNTSNRLLEEKSQKFVAQNRDQLDIILNPFKEKLKEFESKVDNVYKSETEQRISLKNGLDNLLQLNKQLNQEAMNLTS